MSSSAVFAYGGQRPIRPFSSSTKMSSKPLYSGETILYLPVWSSVEKQSTGGWEAGRDHEEFPIITSRTSVPSVVIASGSVVQSLSAKHTKAWEDFESLYGAWIDRADIGDDWLDNLRNEWDDDLSALYETD